MKHDWLLFFFYYDPSERSNVHQFKIKYMGILREMIGHKQRNLVHN